MAIPFITPLVSGIGGLVSNVLGLGEEPAGQGIPVHTPVLGQAAAASRAADEGRWLDFFGNIGAGVGNLALLRSLGGRFGAARAVPVAGAQTGALAGQIFNELAGAGMPLHLAERHAAARAAAQLAGATGRAPGLRGVLGQMARGYGGSAQKLAGQVGGVAGPAAAKVGAGIKGLRTPKTVAEGEQAVNRGLQRLLYGKRPINAPFQLGTLGRKAARIGGRGLTALTAYQLANELTPLGRVLPDFGTPGGAAPVASDYEIRVGLEDAGLDATQVDNLMAQADLYENLGLMNKTEALAALVPPAIQEVQAAAAQQLMMQQATSIMNPYVQQIQQAAQQQADILKGMLGGVPQQMRPVLRAYVDYQQQAANQLAASNAAAGLVGPQMVLAEQGAGGGDLASQLLGL